RVNLDGTRGLLEACRRVRKPPRLLFTSSVAVFGAPLPALVTDATTPVPQSSYGIQKLIGELLVGDYSRKGFIDGRTVRLPTVSVRPGKPNAAASSFASGILREPLNGVEAICPVEPETELWLISPRLAVKCLLHAFELPSERLGAIRSLSLPGITASVREMVASLERVAGPAAPKRIRWEPDEKIKAIVKSWPARFDTARADSLGFPRDEGGFDRIIADYVHEEGVKLQPQRKRLYAPSIRFRRRRLHWRKRSCRYAGRLRLKQAARPRTRRSPNRKRAGRNRLRLGERWRETLDFRWR